MNASFNKSSARQFYLHDKWYVLSKRKEEESRLGRVNELCKWDVFGYFANFRDRKYWILTYLLSVDQKVATSKFDGVLWKKITIFISNWHEILIAFEVCVCTYIELPHDLIRCWLSLNSAVKVDISSFINTLRGDRGAQSKFHAGGIWNKKKYMRSINLIEQHVKLFSFYVLWYSYELSRMNDR